MKEETFAGSVAINDKGDVFTLSICKEVLQRDGIYALKVNGTTILMRETFDAIEYNRTKKIFMKENDLTEIAHIGIFETLYNNKGLVKWERK